MRWTRSTSSEPADGRVSASTGRPGLGPDRPGGPGSVWESVRRLLPAVRTTMEYCWLHPWLVVIGGGVYGPQGRLLSAGWVLAIMLVAQLAARPALERVAPLPRARAVLVGTGLVLGMAAVRAQHFADIPLWSPAWIVDLLVAAHDALPGLPRPVLAALVAACLWWRGLALGLRETDAAAIEAAYKTGVAAIVLYLLAAAVYGDSQGFAAAGPVLPGSLPAFFFLGLSALALARLAVIWDRSQPDERAHFPARAWVLLVVGVVGLILLAASLSAGLAAADVTAYLGVALRPFLPVIEVLFVVLFFVAEIIVRVIIAILSRLPRRDVPELSPPPTVFDDILRRLREIAVHPQVIEGARWSMVAAVVLLLVVGMALTIVLMRRRERTPGDDEHESVWSARDLWGGLRGLLPRLRVRRDADDAAGPAAGRIRRIYRELLRLGAAAGAPRHPAATPREHEPRLRGVLPEAGGEVDALTDIYERVRYGSWHPPAAEVRAAEEALRRISAAAGP